MSDAHAIPCMHGMPTENIHQWQQKRDTVTHYVAFLCHSLEIILEFLVFTLLCKQHSTADNYLFSCTKMQCINRNVLS